MTSAQDLTDTNLGTAERLSEALAEVFRGTGWAARRGARWAGPFPCGLPPNRTGPFPSIRLSSDHAVAAVGEWMASWQGWQTMRVLRRFLAMSTAHSG
jgi:hypothetical protein